MPPHSKSLSEEGAAFKSFLLVDGGVFNEKGIVDELTHAGTRNLADNISDLKAQIAANHKGIQLVRELIDIYGLNVVQAFMNYIQQNASECVRDMLKEIAIDARKRTGESVLHAVEFMDDGTPISLKITIDESNGNATFDFTGTGFEVYGNCNTPKAIVMSAIIYCLRCMVGFEIPLNQGCLNPINVVIPDNSILNPSENAAVVGGNVLTSQRIVDVILKAFSVCAASCGCMNNVTIGDENFGYYETVGGGSGAGFNWHGTSGVHTHMTNTRITDLEIVEQRYPMILKSFCLRDDESGGKGFYKGGEGIKRELMFRKPVTLSVLTERRAIKNYGLEGGESGKLGLNLLKKADGKIINLGGKTQINVGPGDVFSMLTPGNKKEIQ
jgi:5-oxoprolinase (ATP-hydrolysing)